MPHGFASSCYNSITATLCDNEHWVTNAFFKQMIKGLEPLLKSANVYVQNVYMWLSYMIIIKIINTIRYNYYISLWAWPSMGNHGFSTSCSPLNLPKKRHIHHVWTNPVGPMNQLHPKKKICISWQYHGKINQHPNIIWLVVSTPLKNDGVRQLGLWHSQYKEK